ncbi:ABC transporter ATP-binding protein [Flintibacter sp. KGMB00164]|uniref:ABC transporter ATP-binding protein/permease n=1 Tax=Flintibacter sp. KGMB00164 TaxID=2610895 RepID=UPI0012466EA2|nr:ABC transporter ATP-binding protein [Flintibacter sp. KGMB00164]
MIQLCDVTKRYGDAVILDQANYAFPEHGVVCLMGASGGGKTTLLNLVAGFDTDYAGEIVVGNVPLHKMDADALCRYRRDNIGFVFQNYHLLTGYTVLENVCLAMPDNITSEETKQKALALLERVGLASKRDQKVETLSGGQKQRAAIARALMGNPQIILADEPTGALDRTTSNEIMELLRELSEERLVVVITHDAKICDFADEIIHIQNRKIVSEGPNPERTAGQSLQIGTEQFGSLAAQAKKNLRVHFGRYFAAAIAVSIGLLAFLFSLSFDNVMEQSILAFQEKNTAFNNGYIKGMDDGTILEYLRSDERIVNAYYQYKLKDISLTIGNKTETMAEKYPMPKATESLSYGVMPREGRKEIVLTPSLAKKFDSNIQNLLGKTVTLKLNETSYILTVSGICNAGYDDFFVSSDIEQQFYRNIPSGQYSYSISYDVGNFTDVVAVTNSLKLRGIQAETAAEEVAALQNTFQRLNQLFQIISTLILVIGLFLAAVLLFKLQSTRYHEVGLLSALGYSRKQIVNMLHLENFLLAALAAVLDIALLVISFLLANIFHFPLAVSAILTVISLAAAFAIVLLLSSLSSIRLIRTEPAVALRK